MTRQQELARVLHQTSLFSGLDEAGVLEVIRRGRLRSFAAGETIFLQGDPATGLHVVVRGRVKVFKSAQARAQTLMIMGPGEPVGEVAALSGGPYPASAETLDETETFYIPRAAFVELIRSEPELALRLLAALSSRLRAFASLIEDLSLRGVTERLAAYLLSIESEGSTGSVAAAPSRAGGATGRAGGPAARGALPGEVLDLGMAKGELAAAVGTVPETLSRAFQQLKRAGAVETKGRSVVIKDRALLERVARAKL